MKEKIKVYKEIAKYLENEEQLYNIENIEKAIKEKRFLLSFVGQFSAGKSKLINNLLGLDLLPVHITETTQVATFMSFSEESEGKIYYKSGKVENVEINFIKEIWEGKERRNKEEISHIEIGVNSKLLENGLVIADTPGINTTIKRHEKETEKILKNSDGCVYVISKAITEIDKIFIKELTNQGLNIITVRTYMDSINSSEENSLDTVKRDCEIIKNIGKENMTNMYHVSNEEDSQWYSKINDIKNYINDAFTVNIAVKIQESCEARIESSGKKLLVDLKNKEEILKKIINGNEVEFHREKELIEKNIKKIIKIIDVKKLKYRNDIIEVKTNGKKEVREEAESIIKKFQRSLNEIEYETNSDFLLKEVLANEIYEASKKIQNTYILQFDSLIKTNYEEIINGLKEELGQITSNIEESIPYDLESLALRKDCDDFEVERLKRKLRSLSEGIEEKEDELASLKVDSEEYRYKKMEIESIVREVEDSIKEYGPYEPRYQEYENSGMKPSTILKNIGTTADWVAMFLPQTAYVGIANKIGKGSAVITKVGNAIGKADKVKDAIYMTKNLGDMVKNAKKTTRASKKRTKEIINKIEKTKEVSEKLGLLNYLTFEYWGEKIGKNFDPAVKLELDREYEFEYKKEKRNLIEKLDLAKEKELKLLKDLGIIRDAEERLKKEKELEKRKLIDIEEELKRRKLEIERVARNKAFDNLKSSYIKFFSKNINELIDTIINNCDEYLNEPLNNYMDKALGSVKYQLNKYCERKEELLKQYSNLNSNEVQISYDKAIEYINFLTGDK